MLILHPREVSFLNVPWKNVTSIVVDRAATKVVADMGDGGPHVVLVDCPEQRVTIRVTMDIAEDTLVSPSLGVQGVLVFATAPTGVNASRFSVSATAVVTAVSHELSLRKGAVRTVELVAVSSNGTADPITIADVSGTVGGVS